MGGVYPLSMIRASFLHRIIQKCPLWANTEFEQATIEFRVIPGTDRDIYVWLTLNNCPTASYRTCTSERSSLIIPDFEYAMKFQAQAIFVRKA